MIKHRILTLALLTAICVGLFSPASTQAQQDINTTLAGAAARSFLTALTRPDLAQTADFYLLDSLKNSPQLAGVQNITGYTVIDGDWISDVTYQTNTVLQPGNRQATVYTGQYNGRWLVEGLDLPTGNTAVSVTETSPAISAQGTAPVSGNGSGKLVFQTQSGGDIYVVNANGTGLQWLTTGIDPQLSPDGTQVAFTRWEPRYELFTINIDGTNEQAITHGWRQMKSPTWSADGTSLTFSWQDGGRLDAEKHRINLAQAAQNEDGVRIPDDAVGIEKDGNIISYILPADTHWRLKQVNLSTGEFTDLGTENYAYGPSANPVNGEQIIFKGDNGLAVYEARQNTSLPVTTNVYDHTPVISPDGSQIAVSYRQNDHWEIHVMNIDGSARQRLTSTPLTVLAESKILTTEFVAGKERVVASENPTWNNAAPIWSPDGSQIVFLTDRTGQWEIWLMNADGSNPRPMFSNGALNGIALSYAGVDERMLSWQ